MNRKDTRKKKKGIISSLHMNSENEVKFCLKIRQAIFGGLLNYLIWEG